MVRTEKRVNFLMNEGALSAFSIHHLEQDDINEDFENLDGPTEGGDENALHAVVKAAGGEINEALSAGPAVKTSKKGKRRQLNQRLARLSQFGNKVFPLQRNGTANQSTAYHESCCQKVMQLLTSVVKLGMSFWVVLGYFVVLAVMDANYVDGMEQISLATFTSGRRAMLAAAVGFWAALPMGPPEWFRYGQGTERLEAYLDQLDSVEQNLKYGNDHTGLEPFLATSGEHFEVMFRNACREGCEELLALEGSSSAPVAKIAALRHGLLLGFERQLGLLQDVLNAQLQLESEGSAELLEKVEAVKAAVQDIPAELIFFHELQEFTHLYLKFVKAELESIRHTKILSCIVLFILLFFAYFWSLHMFRILDREVRQSFTLFFVLPQRVFVIVPELYTMINGSYQASVAKKKS